MASGYLFYITDAIVEALNLKSGDKAYKKELLKKLTKPFTNLFVQLDKKVIYKWSMGEVRYYIPRLGYDTMKDGALV